MNAREFFDLVVEMRKQQKLFFAIRNNDVLNESRRLERAVDAEIKRVEAVMLSKRNCSMCVYCTSPLCCDKLDDYIQEDFALRCNDYTPKGSGVQQALF